MPLGGRKITSFAKRVRGGTATPNIPVEFSVTETVNEFDVTYDITSNLPENVNVYYQITGNVVANDFTDSNLQGYATIDANGNATLVKTLTNTNLTASNVTTDFALDFVRTLPDGVKLYEGNTHIVESIIPLQATTTSGFEANVTVGNVDYKIFNLSSANTVVYSAEDIPVDFTITDLGSYSDDIEILIVGGGGGAGLGRQRKDWPKTWPMGGGGGGGANSMVTTMPISSFTTTTYTGTIGHGGAKTASGGPLGGTHNVSADAGNVTTFLGYTMESGGPGTNTLPITPKSNVTYPRNRTGVVQSASSYIADQSGNGGNGGGSHGGGGGGGAGIYDLYQGDGIPDYVKGGDGGRPSTRLVHNPPRSSLTTEWLYSDGYFSESSIDRSLAGDGCLGNLEISGWYKNHNTFEANTFVLGTGGGGGAGAPYVSLGTYTFYNGENQDNENYGDGGSSKRLGGPTITNKDGNIGTIQLRWPNYNGYRRLIS